MEIVDSVLADSVMEGDVISFVITFTEEGEEIIGTETMIVSTVHDNGESISIKGESNVTGDSVLYDLAPDHLVNILGA